MDEDDIDTFDLPLRPKVKPVFKKKPVDTGVSSSRRITTLIDDNDTGESRDELDVSETNPEPSFKPRFKRKVTGSDASSSRRTTTVSIDNGDETVDAASEGEMDVLGTWHTVETNKKESTDSNALSSSRRTRVITIDDDIEEEGEVDEVEVRIKPSLTSQRRDQHESSKRRLNLSKYKVSDKEDDKVVNETLVPESNNEGLAATDVDNLEAKFEKEPSLPPDAKLPPPEPASFASPSTDQRLATPQLEIDQDDPENDPVIANLDELREMFSPEKESSVPPDIKIPSGRSASYEPFESKQDLYSSPPHTLPRSYVPISSNAEPTLSKRQYLNQIASEYNDDKNYDDGAPTSNRELRQPDFDPEHNKNNTHDFELSDEDMGVLKRNIDFENKYNDEIISDYGASESEADYDHRRWEGGPDNIDLGYGYGYQRRSKRSTVRVYTIQEQIERIEHELKLARAKQMQKEAARVTLLKQKEEIKREKEALIKKLQDWKL